MSETAKVVVIGAAGMDTKGRVDSLPVYGMSIPGEIRISPGGVARNVAENLARLGVHTILLSALGNDDAGRQVLEQARSSGIDMSHIKVYENARTAAYLAIIDEEGMPLASVYDMGIMELITPRYIYNNRGLIKEANMVLIDANLSPEALKTLFNITRRYHVPVCADPTSANLASRLKPHLKDLYLITPNEAEAEVLCGMSIKGRDSAITAAKELVAKGVDIAIITLAEMGVCYATSNTSGHIPAIKTDVVDLTGAGDALTAGVAFGILNNFSIDEAIRLGVSAATLTLRCRETVCPDLSLEKLYDGLVI
ncbi:MAG: ribokinase [Chloroflexi bacterium]|nr:MAG: ribokinase [Chloroflexota bacterium]HDN80932.1 ribokinase [Chloroflexota bacterium]